MRLKELCELSGYPSATVKYYLREELLHAGTPVNARESDYDERHLERLRLIRALREIGDLPISAVRQVVAAIETPHLDVHSVLASAVHALGPAPIGSDAADRSGRDDVLAYIAEAGWTVDPGAPAVDMLAAVLTRIREFWGDVGPEVFDRYRAAIDELAAGDLDVIGDLDDLESDIRRMVIGTVLWDQAIIALRRLAAENQSRRRYTERPQGRPPAGGTMRSRGR